ncbi:MAG TPA: glycosyltransferase [Arenimonas sp.]|nr:glycosyltransferase [Arenimonas sp.]
MSRGAAAPLPIVTVSGALAALDRSLAALDRNLPASSEVLALDASGGDPRMAQWLDAWCERTPLQVERMQAASGDGVVAAWNLALSRSADRDVLLLAPGMAPIADCMARMQQALDRDAGIASVTAWSNNAEHCSYPQFNPGEPPPSDSEAEALAEAAAQLAPACPELPVAASGCVLMRGAALRLLGGLDADTFAQPSAALHDWCLRAAAMGWRHVLCDTAFAVDAGSDRVPVFDSSAAGGDLERLMARWPEYSAALARFLMSDPLHAHRLRLQAARDALRSAGPQRDLFGALPSVL